MGSNKPTLTGAPRLRAYLNRNLGALIMVREDWETIVKQLGHPVEIDISDTPLAPIIQTGQVVASFAQKLSSNRIRILIFREDQKDAPDHINLDRYLVFEKFRARDDYRQFVTSSSTDDGPAMQDFHRKYVIIIPEEKTSGHHLPDIPGIYKATIGLQGRDRPT